MDAGTWSTLENLIEKQNGALLSTLLTDLIAYCEISSVDKDEVLQLVIRENNTDLLNAVAHHYDLTRDNCIQFQIALYNKLYNLLEALSPPQHLWSTVVEELCLDQNYSCLDFWSQWANNNALDQQIANTIEVDYYHSEARDLFTQIGERIQARTTHRSLTEAIQDSGRLKAVKKM